MLCQLFLKDSIDFHYIGKPFWWMTLHLIFILNRDRTVDKLK